VRSQLPNPGAYRRFIRTNELTPETAISMNHTLKVIISRGVFIEDLDVLMLAIPVEVGG